MLSEYVKIIVTNVVELTVKALTFIPGLSKEEFDAAITEAQTQLENAKAAYGEASDLPIESKIVSMVNDAMEIAHASCNAAGVTKADNFFEMADTVLDGFEDNPKHPYAAAFKAWWKKTFGKKNKGEVAPESN